MNEWSTLAVFFAHGVLGGLFLALVAYVFDRINPVEG